MVTTTRAITIREACIADAQVMCDYANALFSEGLETLFLRPADMTVEKEREFIERVKATPTALILLALAETDMIGMLHFTGHPKPQMAHGGEFGLSVAKNFRGQGIGRKLILELLTWAEVKGLRRVELRVFSNNEGAIGLYQSLGFNIEGRQKEAVRLHHTYIDLISMVKFI